MLCYITRLTFELIDLERVIYDEVQGFECIVVDILFGHNLIVLVNVVTLIWYLIMKFRLIEGG